MTTDMTARPELRDAAVKQLRKKRGLQAHVLAYVMVNLLINCVVVAHHARRLLLADLPAAWLGDWAGLQHLGRLCAGAHRKADPARDEPVEPPLGRREDMRQWTVGDVMTRDVITVTPDARTARSWTRWRTRCERGPGGRHTVA